MKLLYTVLLITLCYFSSGHAKAFPDTSFHNTTAVEFYLQMHLYENPLIIDTRTYREYRKERIPTAVLAENPEELLRIVDTLDRDYALLVYCSDNYRSPVACRILAEKGFSNIYNLEEGLIGWKRAGYTIDQKKLGKRKRGTNQF